MIEKIKGTSKKIAGSRKFQTALLFAPGFTIYALLILLSIVLCFYYSLFDWDGVKNTMNFVGFFNYIKALADPALRGSLKVTFFFAILGTAFVNIVAMTISVQLSKPGILTNFYRSAFFFPQLISLVAIGFIFKSLLSYIGIINTIFAKWDFPLIDFLGSPDELLSIVVDEKISNPSFFSRGLFLEDSIFTKHTLNNPGDQLVST